MSETLKSCPFCGTSAGVCAKEGLFAAACDTWGCYGSFAESLGRLVFSSYAEAIAAWNRRASGWISVDERLPEEEGEYLVARSGLAYGVATFAVSPGGAPSGIWSLPRVGHWQPLQPPEAP